MTNTAIARNVKSIRRLGWREEINSKSAPNTVCLEGNKVKYGRSIDNGSFKKDKAKCTQ